MVGCAVSICHNHTRTRNQDITYHSFPKDPKLIKIWVAKCRRTTDLNVPQSRVCSEHFLPSDYQDDMKNRLLGLRERKILKPGSIPSVKLSSSDADDKEKISRRAERIRLRNIRQRALKRLKSLSPKRVDDSEMVECCPEIDHLLQSTGSTSKDDDRKTDLPLEPAIEIKEEPVDYEPAPSTSTEAANEEFILPHEENTWTPGVQPPPNPAMEPQLTLSVASLATHNNLETSTSDEQVGKKRKTKSATYVPSTNGSEPRPVSPVYNFGESSDPGSLKEPRKDQFDVFGEYIAAKLRSLDKKSCAFAQKAIGDIIFEAEMGKYLSGDSESKVLNTSAS